MVRSVSVRKLDFHKGGHDYEYETFGKNKFDGK